MIELFFDLYPFQKIKLHCTLLFFKRYFLYTNGNYITINPLSITNRFKLLLSLQKIKAAVENLNIQTQKILKDFLRHTFLFIKIIETLLKIK